MSTVAEVLTKRYAPNKGSMRPHIVPATIDVWRPRPLIWPQLSYIASPVKAYIDPDFIILDALDDGRVHTLRERHHGALYLRLCVLLRGCKRFYDSSCSMRVILDDSLYVKLPSIYHY